MSADLDREIDRAVGEMLDVEPPAGLRARVMQRIEERHAASGFSRKVTVASAFRRKILWAGLPVAACAPGSSVRRGSSSRFRDWPPWRR